MTAFQTTGTSSFELADGTERRTHRDQLPEWSAKVVVICCGFIQQLRISMLVSCNASLPVLMGGTSGPRRDLGVLAGDLDHVFHAEGLLQQGQGAGCNGLLDSGLR